MSPRPPEERLAVLESTVHAVQTSVSSSTSVLDRLEVAMGSVSTGIAVLTTEVRALAASVAEGRATDAALAARVAVLEIQVARVYAVAGAALAVAGILGADRLAQMGAP